VTTPIQHGYPDWGRFDARADVVLAVTSVINHAGQDYGPFFVGHITHLAFYLGIGTRGVDVTFKFYSDAALSVQLGELIYSLAPGALASWSIPVTAPYLVVNFQPQGGNSDWDFRLWSVAGNVPKMWGDGPPIALISDLGHNVAGGGVVVVAATEVVPGDCHFEVDTTVATWQAFLETVDSTGTVTRIARITNTLNIVPQRLLLPPALSQVRINNQTGAAGLFNTILVSSGYYR
jgi:hypothetical protein